MAVPSELEQIEADFLSGKNPLAYIPLCHHLRRQKNYVRALELCLRGLEGDPNSIAGRTLHCRLLLDLGRYEEAWRELQKAEVQAADAQGLKKEKARCLLALGRIEEASTELEQLAATNPLDPDVQLLNNQFRRLRGQQALGSGGTSREENPRFLRPSNQDILRRLLEEMKPLATIRSAAVIPIGAGEPALEGTEQPAEVAYTFYRDVSKACRDLEAGALHVGLLETENAQLIVLVRNKTLVSFSIEPTAKFGKLYHRLVTAVGQLLPEAG